MVAAEFNLIEEHSEAAVKEAQSFKLEVRAGSGGEWIFARCRFITIDGETARDFDDAVYVERKKSGFYLWSRSRT